MAITNEWEWMSLGSVEPQRGDILIKKVFAGGGGMETLIVGMQKVTVGLVFPDGHASAEHAAVVIGSLFVAEAEGAGVVANSLATSDRATTKYVVYRSTREEVGRKAAELAEAVARGRGMVRYDPNSRHTGGGYKFAGAIRSLAGGPGLRPLDVAVPGYLQNVIDYAEGRTNHRMWAFCSMFACACFEAACIVLDRLRPSAGPSMTPSYYRDYALRVNPSTVSPLQYEASLNQHPQYRLMGRYCFEDNPETSSRVELFERLKQAVEDYKKTFRGGGLGGWQATKIALSFRKVSPESQRAVDELDKQVRLCEERRRAPRQFDSQVETFYLLLLHYIQAPREKVAVDALSADVRGLLFGDDPATIHYGSPKWTQAMRSYGNPLTRGSTFYEILVKCNDQLLATSKVSRTAEIRRNNRMGTRL